MLYNTRVEILIILLCLDTILLYRWKMSCEWNFSDLGCLIL